MTILQTVRTTVHLDRKECFELWIELGSLEKVRQLFYNQGRKNFFGNAFSIFGIRNAALKYALWDMDVAHKRLLEAGSKFTKIEFNHWCMYKALQFYGANRFREWLKYAGMFDPTGELGYKVVYERKFPRLHIAGN